MNCPKCKTKLSMKPTADGQVTFLVCEDCGWSKELAEVMRENGN